MDSMWAKMAFTFEQEPMFIGLLLAEGPKWASGPLVDT
jgi:hypothetical protein